MMNMMPEILLYFDFPKLFVKNSYKNRKNLIVFDGPGRGS